MVVLNGKVERSLVCMVLHSQGLEHFSGVLIADHPLQLVRIRLYLLLLLGDRGPKWKEHLYVSASEQLMHVCICMGRGCGIYAYCSKVHAKGVNVRWVFARGPM